MKKTADLCDTCKNTVASFKCKFCGADMCRSHIHTVNIGFTTGDYNKEDIKSIGIYMNQPYVSENSETNRDFLCNVCTEKIRQQWKLLSKSFDKNRENEIDLVRELLAIIEKYARIEAI